MYKKTIKYTDYNGVEREEDFYFHLDQVELTDMELSVDGGLTAYISQLVKASNTRELVETLKMIINKSYGVKSPDGRRFMKKPEYLEEFMETPAYSILYMDLATNEEAAAEFINKVVPTNLSSSVNKASIEKLMADNKPATT